MEKCAVCGKPNGKGKHTLTTHHFFWPKAGKMAKGKNQRLIQVCRACHNTGPQSYHSFYTHNCRHKRDMGCYACNYQSICCYQR